MRERVIERLRKNRIQPTPQRIAVAEYVLSAESHPSADEVWERVREACPTLSRATVYNTLNLFVERGLLQTQVLKGGVVVFDPNVVAHHHFIDEETGEIFDVPWNSVRVVGEGSLPEFEVREYQVVMRGRRRPAGGGSRQSAVRGQRAEGGGQRHSTAKQTRRQR